jgi:hypothetical protein
LARGQRARWSRSGGTQLPAQTVFDLHVAALGFASPQAFATWTCNVDEATALAACDQLAALMGETPEGGENE